MTWLSAWHLAIGKAEQTYGALFGVGVILLMEEILHQLICSLSQYLQGFVHPRSQVVQDFFHQQYQSVLSFRNSYLANLKGQKSGRKTKTQHFLWSWTKKTIFAKRLWRQGWICGFDVPSLIGKSPTSGNHDPTCWAFHVSSCHWFRWNCSLFVFWIVFFNVSNKKECPGNSLWPFWDGYVTLSLVKWPLTGGSKGHFESPGCVSFQVFWYSTCSLER